MGTSRPAAKRPRSVTWLSVLVFILGLLQWTRAYTLHSRSDFLAQLPLAIPLPYAIATAGLWGGLLLAAAFGLWRLRAWGRRLALGAVTAWQAHAWVDRVLFERSDYSQLTTGAALAASLALLAFTWLALWQARETFESAN